MITTSQFMKACPCRSAGECRHNSFAEFHALHAMVDAFAAEMKAKLARKCFEGVSGWDDPATRPIALELLRSHIEKGDMVDVANFAAMLWNMEQR